MSDLRNIIFHQSAESVNGCVIGDRAEGAFWTEIGAGSVWRFGYRLKQVSQFYLPEKLE